METLYINNFARENEYRPGVLAEGVFCRDPKAPITADTAAPFDDDWLSKRSESEQQNVRSMYPECDLLIGKREVVVRTKMPSASINLATAREAAMGLPEENNPNG